MLLLAQRRQDYNAPSKEEAEAIQALAQANLPPLDFASEPVYLLLPAPPKGAGGRATIKAKDREIVLRDVPVGESPYNLLLQVNVALTQSCQPFVAWRLEWISGEVDRLWPEGVPQVCNEHGSPKRNSFCFARYRLRLR